MKFGFNLLLWTGHVEEEHFDLIKDIKKTGYDGVEIPLFGGDIEHYEKIGHVLKDNGLGATAVTVIPDQAHNCLSDNAAEREAGAKHIKWAIDCCAASGADVLVGPYHQPLGEFTGEGATEQEKENAAGVHREVAGYAQDAGVLLGIESLNRFECYFLNTIEDAAAYAKRVNHPNFGTMYDTFHANIEEKDPAGVITPHLDVINHVHISENDRGTPGDGHIDFAPVFKALKGGGYDKWITIEAFGRALPDLAAATRVWRDFFPSQEYVYQQGFEFMKAQWDAA